MFNPKLVACRLMRVKNKEYKIEYTMIWTIQSSYDFGLDYVKWVQPIYPWSLTMNLMAQPQENNELWKERSNNLSYKEISSPSISHKIKINCIKLSFGFIARIEKELQLFIPDVIKRLIPLFLEVEACEFQEFHINDGMPSGVLVKYVPPHDSLIGMKVHWENQHNQPPKET